MEEPDSQPVSDLAKLFEIPPDYSHAAKVLMVATLLERVLEQILQAQMPNLSGKLKEKIFSGYGPFSTFSAKIDVSQALGLITAEEAKDLNDIRGVRNFFAHSDELLHFGHEAFDSPKIKNNPLKRSEAMFFAAAANLVATIKPRLETAALIGAIAARKAARGKTDGL
ncbi:hypothetical protein [Rhizobium sp. BG4]|uniref:hypothetical protein n=1 Tax=Rhizobium sp. BG4 TaxID=2613770 RepID=UPI00193E7B33|nr:hypothetical protein [Rhizobium sp. BG4]QRM45353.1 hypothetical protein F2982_19045 [Rhizobium sp. BG4]